MNLQPTLVPASGCLDLAFSRSGEGATAEVAVWWGITRTTPMLNVGAELMKDGITRVANDLAED